MAGHDVIVEYSLYDEMAGHFDMTVYLILFDRQLLEYFGMTVTMDRLV